MQSFEPPYVYGDIVYDPSVADAYPDEHGHMEYEFAHRVRLPDGTEHKMPFEAGRYAEQGDVEAWIQIGCPVEAKPFTGRDHFTDGDLDWLVEIAAVHGVAPGDHTGLAVLARLYGDASPES